MLRTALVVAIVQSLVFGVLAQEAPQLSTIRADYERTLVLPATGEVRVLEVGTYYLVPDGRYRVDKLIDGERTSLISLPGEGERITLNHELGLAVRGSDRLPWVGPSIQPPPLRESDARTESLGLRMLGPLALTGFRQAVPIPDVGNIVNEWWVWMNHGTPPILVEMTYTGPDGLVDSQRISTARLATMTTDEFKVPPSYGVQDLRKP